MLGVGKVGLLFYFAIFGFGNCWNTFLCVCSYFSINDCCISNFCITTLNPINVGGIGCNYIVLFSSNPGRLIYKTLCVFVPRKLYHRFFGVYNEGALGDFIYKMDPVNGNMSVSTSWFIPCRGQLATRLIPHGGLYATGQGVHGMQCYIFIDIIVQR